MTAMGDPKYEAMRSKRAELDRAIVELYGSTGDQAVRKVYGAFLRYEGAVLQLLQDDLNAIDILIQRVDQAEGATNNG